MLVFSFSFGKNEVKQCLFRLFINKNLFFLKNKEGNQNQNQIEKIEVEIKLRNHILINVQIRWHISWQILF